MFLVTKSSKLLLSNIVGRSEHWTVEDCGQIDVMFSDNKIIESLNNKSTEERDMYIDPPGL